MELGSTLLGEMGPTTSVRFLPSCEDKEKLDWMLLGTTLFTLIFKTALGQSWIIASIDMACGVLRYILL